MSSFDPKRILGTVDENMIFKKVDKNNIDTLYKLNIQLASDEGQRELFSAKINEYSSAFLDYDPVLYAYILHNDQNEAIGFYAYYFKFASYIGAKVLYVEDVYLVSKHRDIKYKSLILEHAIQIASDAACCRVELRMLKAFNIGYAAVKSLNFEPVHKWEVYRLDKPSTKK